ncbi:MAG: apolipoprotein N-acyltransferase [Pseudomonadota bacterium]
MQGLFVLLLAPLAGYGLSYSQAPYEYWWLIFPCFSVFYFLYATLKTKKAVFFISFLFSFSYFVGGLNWIGNALLVEGNEYRWVWPLAVIALPILLSLFSASLLAFSAGLTKRRTTTGFLAFCIFLSLSEYLRSIAFTGFPWNLYGYTWLGFLPIAQIANIFGPFMLTFLTIFWGAFLGYFILKPLKSLVVIMIALIIFSGSFAYGYLRLATVQDIYFENYTLKIIQPNIAQEDKWKREKLLENFEKHLSLSNTESQNQKQIIIWPETAISDNILISEEIERIGNEILNQDDILLSGVLAAIPDDQKIQYHNALYKFESDRIPERLYSKNHLVPFGEYIPFQDFIPLKPVVDFTGFEQGGGSITIINEGYPSFSPQICYEIIFPQNMIGNSEPRPDYILTVTNDAWYGDSAGPYQHFAQARMRAIEQGLPIVRSANTGISGIINPYGVILKSLPLLEDGVISAKLPKKLEDTTFYARAGNWTYLLFMFLSVSFFFLRVNRRKK